VATTVLELSTSTQRLGIPSANLATQAEIDWHGCLNFSPLFLGLSADEQSQIASSAREVWYSQGETLFLQNDPVRHVFVVTQGVVKITQITEDGKETLLRLESSGGLLDDVIGSELPHLLTARALQACRVLVWETSKFGAFTQRMTAIHRNAAVIMRTRLRILQERFCDVATRPVPQRLARLVIHLAEKVPGSLSPIELSREDLAQMAGTSLFTVSRLLCAWADLNIVTVERKAVMIEDLSRLLELTEAA